MVGLTSPVIALPGQEAQQAMGSGDPRSAPPSHPRRSPRVETVRRFAGRIVNVIAIILAAYTIAFFLMALAPGDPVDQILGVGGTGRVTDAQIEEVREKYGLDGTLVERYLYGIAGLLHGNLGTSYANGGSVSNIVFSALPDTVELALFALAVSVALALAIMFASVLPRTQIIQRFAASLPVFVVSVPPFLLGLLMLQLFSFTLKWFPAAGSDGFQSLVLPGLLLGFAGAATLGQILVQSFRTNVAAPYVLTARARGRSHRAAAVREATRNSLVPALGALATVVGSLFAYAVVAETIFSRNGIGRVMVEAVQSRDVPVVQGIVIVIAAVYALTSFAVDALLPAVDPRLRRGASQ